MFHIGEKIVPPDNSMRGEAIPGPVIKRFAEKNQRKEAVCLCMDGGQK